MVLGLGVSLVTSKASTYPPVREIGKTLRHHHQLLGTPLLLIPGDTAPAGKGRLRVKKVECRLGMRSLEQEMSPKAHVSDVLFSMETLFCKVLETSGGRACLEEAGQ